ncbi:unnamed protein product [Blepharisma stoltei]|uniref:Uncharacterized protein n=1 Tax=Blepharisma stoltei TaxID=1481888 RepID=A0AAU9JRT9_9CILI|nr:unnamed protein product [Blepharisma stoltei]
MWQRLSIALLWLLLSTQSLASKDIHETPKFSLKSLTDPHLTDYYPLRISLEVDDDFLQNTQLNKTVKSAADTTMKILSYLVLSKASKSGFKFGEKIQCDDFLIHQIVKSQGIDADFGLFIKSSSDFEDDLITIKKCESGSQLFVISMAINPEKFLALGEVSQIKSISSAISSIIFEDNLYRNQLLSEVEDYLTVHAFEYMPAIADTGCNPPISNCVTCKTPTVCFNCSASYLPNEDGTQCCAGEYCKTCNGGFNCDSCIDDYIYYNGECHPCPSYCALCNTTACVECDPGYYPLEGIMCMWCSTGCEICHAGPSSLSICTQCYDIDNSVLIDGECSCKKANQIYNQNNICVCAPGYYEDTNGICQPCNTGCETCTSPSQCITCFDKNLTIANADGSCSCKTNELTYNTTTHTCDCPRGEYPDLVSGLCDPCQDSCAWCIAYDICFECINNSILYNSGNGNCTCLDGSKIYDPTTNTCVPCPDGKYAFDGNCYNCISPCAACSYYDHCTECFPGMHLSSSNASCVCNDPTQTFNSSTNTCGDCTEGSCKCTDSQVYDPTTKTCVSCPTGKYASDGVCSPCQSTCLACSSSSECTQCYQGMDLSSNGACECTGTNEVFDPTSKTCQASCSDPSKVYDPLTKSCDNCPNGKYASDGVCLPCQSNCLTCTNNNGCTECYSGMTLLSNNTCVCSDSEKIFDPSAKSCKDCSDTQNGCENNSCAEGCILCASPEVCETCYDSENMVNNNGVCSCAKPNQKFSVSEKKCVDSSSAKGLVLAWILALYAAI